MVMAEGSPQKAPVHSDLFAEVDWRDELERTWARKWGAMSEIGKLRMALVSRPTENEVHMPDVGREWVFGQVELERMQKEHDQYVEILKSEGVEVAYMDVPAVAMGPYGRLRMLTYTHSIVIIDGGAILSRYGLAPWRRGTEVYQQRALAKLGCPILYQIHGKATLEFGGNMCWLDPKHMVIGIGPSSTLDGVEQVTPILKRAGVEEIHLAYFSDFMHLDLILGIPDAWLAMVDPVRLNIHTIDYLKKKGFNILEVPDEEARKQAINIVTLEPGKVIMPAGSPKTAAMLREEGVDVIDSPFTEGAKQQSAARCSTCDMIRDKGPFLPSS
jgi:N-dimethylarginine dimethylaminohydrolase